MSPLDTVVTKKTIYELAQHNYIVRAFVQQHEHGGLPWESVLASCVYYLAKTIEDRDKFIANHMGIYLLPKTWDTKGDSDD